MKKIYSLFLALFFSASVFAAGHVVTASTTGASCFGSCNGTASSLVSGAIGPVGFSWAGPSSYSSSSQNIVGLCAGSYTITVTDSADMSTSNYIVSVSQPTLLTIGSSGGVICGSGCTTLSPIASGGTPPYTYSWSGGLFGGSPSACPASTTTYTVTIVDVNGCVATSSSTVTVYSLPAVTVNSPTICAGGTATLTGGGASAYVWNPGGATTVSINVSPAVTTSYTVTGTAPTGCTASAVSTVTVMPLPAVTVNSPTICVGDTAYLTAGGAMTYSWSMGAVSNPAPVSPSTTTTYTVTGSTGGCTNSAISTVTVNPLPTITVPTNTICYGSCVTITPTATPGATYLWWGTVSSLSSTTIANPIACPLFSTSYSVTVTYMGCTATTVGAVLVDGPITSGITSTNATGCGICDGAVSSAPLGGTPPYVYMWSPIGATTPSYTGLCAGTYIVNIWDSAGCLIIDSTTIYSANDLIANFTMVPDSTDPYNFFAFNSSTGTGLSYSWYWSDGSPDPGTANPSHYYPALGTYNICLTVSNFLCGADTLCQDLAVTGVSTPCNALFNIADDTINPDPNAHYVYNLSYGATLSYLWDFGDGTTSTSATPSHVYSGTGPYLLCLSIDNGAGCTDMFCDSLISADSLNRSSGTMQLVVYDVPTFYSLATGIANATEAGNVTIAPNPFNETTVFTVNSKEIYSFELTDVLGKKVKSKNGISEKQFEISREGLENGIYFYKIYTAESVIGIGKVVIK